MCLICITLYYSVGIFIFLYGQNYLVTIVELRVKELKSLALVTNIKFAFEINALLSISPNSNKCGVRFLTRISLLNRVVSIQNNAKIREYNLNKL